MQTLDLIVELFLFSFFSIIVSPRLPEYLPASFLQGVNQTLFPVAGGRAFCAFVRLVAHVCWANFNVFANFHYHEVPLMQDSVFGCLPDRFRIDENSWSDGWACFCFLFIIASFRLPEHSPAQFKLYVLLREPSDWPFCSLGCSWVLSQFLCLRQFP